MRLLTDAELMLIAGGTDSTSDQNITLTGNPGTGGGYWGGSGGIGYGGPGSSGGDNHSPSGSDDCAAGKINDEIKEKPDSSKYEYQGVIYRDSNGTIRSTEAKTSHLPTSTQQFSLEEWGIPPGSVIIGTVHNHPTHTIQNPNDPNSPAYPVPESSRELQSQPSWHDMDRMKSFAEGQRDRGISGWQNYTTYISFDGVVKEFKYSDQDWSKHPATNPGQSQTAIESNYTPCR